MPLELPEDLAMRITDEARRLHVTPQQRLVELLDGRVAPARNFAPGALELGMERLRSVVARIPGVAVLQTSLPAEPLFWIRFRIDPASPVAWNIVQELSFVLNDQPAAIAATRLAAEERLPTLFMPLSPPPYLNGGPDDFLAWVIESRIEFQDPGQIAMMLENRLPRPLEKPDAWITRPEDVPGGKEE